MVSPYPPSSPLLPLRRLLRLDLALLGEQALQPDHAEELIRLHRIVSKVVLNHLAAGVQCGPAIERHGKTERSWAIVDDF